MRLLVFASLALALFQSQIPAPGTPKVGSPSQQHGRSEPANPQASKGETVNPTPAINQPTCVVYEQGSQNGGGECKTDSASNGWITFFTFILAAAAIAQFVAMWLQRDYMRRQWQEMEKQVGIAGANVQTAKDAAEAADRSAKATERALRLQESAFGQYLTLIDWEVNRDRQVGPEFTVSFDVVNPTKIPLRLDFLVFEFSGQRHTESFASILVPDSPRGLTAPIQA